MQSYPTYLRPWIVFAALFVVPFASILADEKSEPPVPVRTVPPEIPISFMRSGESGLVTVSFTVDEKGQVQNAAVEKSSARELEEPALKAIRKWRFKPAMKEGNPVAVRVSIPLKFEIT